MTGYYVHASDGEIGHVEDLLIDPEKWAIRYIVVDTRNWWPGKKVIVPPGHITVVNWSDGSVSADLPREQVCGAPEYDPHKTLDRVNEESYHEYYRISVLLGSAICGLGMFVNSRRQSDQVTSFTLLHRARGFSCRAPAARPDAARTSPRRIAGDGSTWLQPAGDTPNAWLLPTILGVYFTSGLLRVLAFATVGLAFGLQISCARSLSSVLYP